jgi:hypothetical protein
MWKCDKIKIQDENKHKGHDNVQDTTLKSIKIV